MKNQFGKFLLCTTVFFVMNVCASEPTLQELGLGVDGQSGQPFGYLTTTILGNPEMEYRVYGTDGEGHYCADRRRPVGGQSFGSGNWKVGWVETHSDYRLVAYSSTNCSSINADSDTEEFINATDNLTPEQLAYDAALLNAIFAQQDTESRLPLTDDLNGNGRLDYYDLESQQYQDYLDYCAENGVNPGDLMDYMAWYQGDLEDWLYLKQNLTDTDGDGFSDGYEAIHGTDRLDNQSYPLGRPDVGTASQIMGGVDSDEPWRYEQYGDSGWSRGHVYEMGYDPFGDTPIETINADFVGPPDWGALDSSGDGWTNQQKIDQNQDPYEFNFQTQSEYLFNSDGGYWEYVGGVAAGPYPWGAPPTLEEALTSAEDYLAGQYAHHPGEYQFGVQEYDEQLDKFEKIKFNVDDVRPAAERDFQVNFNIPIPGGHNGVHSISVKPSSDNPAGAALETLRLLVRGMTVVVISYVFVKHVWTVIRQY